MNESIATPPSEPTLEEVEKAEVRAYFKDGGVGLARWVRTTR